MVITTGSFPTVRLFDAVNTSVVTVTDGTAFILPRPLDYRITLLRCDVDLSAKTTQCSPLSFEPCGCLQGEWVNDAVGVSTTGAQLFISSPMIVANDKVIS